MKVTKLDKRNVSLLEQFNNCIPYDVYSGDNAKVLSVFTSNEDGYGTYNEEIDLLRSRFLVMLLHSINPELYEAPLDEEIDGYTFGCLRASLEQDIEKSLNGGKIIYNDETSLIKNISLLLDCTCEYPDFSELEGIEFDETDPEPYIKPLIQEFENEFGCTLINPKELQSYEFYDIKSTTSCLAVFYPSESDGLVDLDCLVSISEEFQFFGLYPDFFATTSFALNCICNGVRGVLVVTFTCEVDNSGYGYTYTGYSLTLDTYDVSRLIILSYYTTCALKEAARRLEVANG